MLLLLVLLLTGVGSFTFGSSSEHAAVAARQPRLVLAETAPLVVRGLGFFPREGVTVTASVSGKGTVRRRTRSAPSGSFRVTIGTVAFDRCGGGVNVVAMGARGDRAVLKLPPRECPPA